MTSLILIAQFLTSLAVGMWIGDCGRKNNWRLSYTLTLAAIVGLILGVLFHYLLIF